MKEMFYIMSDLCIYPINRYKEFLDFMSKDNFENPYLTYLHVLKNIILTQINYDINYVKGYIISIHLRIFEVEKRIVVGGITNIDNLQYFTFMFDIFKIVLLNNSILEDILEIFKLLLPDLLTLISQKCETMDLAYNDAFKYLGDISIVFHLFNLMVVLFNNR